MRKTENLGIIFAFVIDNLSKSLLLVRIRARLRNSTPIKTRLSIDDKNLTARHHCPHNCTLSIVFFFGGPSEDLN